MIMPIVRVKSLTATAEIAGLVREVGYDGEKKRLWVEALNADEALELLRCMGRASKDMVLGVTPNEAEIIDVMTGKSSADLGAPATVPTVTAKEEAPKVAKKRTRKKKAVKVEKKAKDEKQEAETKTEVALETSPKPEPQPEPQPKKEVVRGVDVQTSEDVPPVDDEKPPEDEAPADGSNGLLKAVKGLKSLRDVVSVLYDHGFTSKEAMINKCEEVSTHLEVVSRIKRTGGSGALRDRVVRAMTVMEMIPKEWS
jgi:outer membrane biosynthesis protein TonB